MRTVRSLATRPWVGYAVALALTALVTGIIALVREFADVTNISILYLLAVLITATVFGSRPAIFASLAAFFAFDFFFINPTHHLTVATSEEWLGLGVLLVTGVITGELAAALQRRARESERRRREAIVLYDVVRLMQTPGFREALTAVAERLREELELAAVVVDFGRDAPLVMLAEAGKPEALQIAHVSSVPPVQILSQVATPPSARSGPLGRWIRIVPPRSQVSALPIGHERLHKVPVHLQGRQVGNILLVREPSARPLSAADDRLLLAVANQLGLTVERIRLREVATEAEDRRHRAAWASRRSTPWRWRSSSTKGCPFPARAKWG
jgi:two-component system sensor histidine kinase KdpD